MLPFKLLYILAAVTCVTGQLSNRGIEYYGTSSVRVQRPYSGPVYRPPHISLPIRPYAPPTVAVPRQPITTGPQPLKDIATQPLVPDVSQVPAYAHTPQTPESIPPEEIAAQPPSVAADQPIEVPVGGELTPQPQTIVTPQPVAVFQPEADNAAPPPAATAPESSNDIASQPLADVTAQQLLETASQPLGENVPQPPVEFAPQPAIELAPHPPFNIAHSLSMENTSQSTIATAPQSSAELTSEKPAEMAPSVPVEITSQSQPSEETAPKLSIETEPQPSLHNADQSTIEMAPQSAREMASQEPVKLSPQPPVERTPQSTLDSVHKPPIEHIPQLSIAIAPHPTAEFHPDLSPGTPPESLVEFNPAVEIMPQPTVEVIPHPQTSQEGALQTSIDLAPRASEELAPENPVTTATHPVIQNSPQAPLAAASPPSAIAAHQPPRFTAPYTSAEIAVSPQAVASVQPPAVSVAASAPTVGLSYPLRPLPPLLPKPKPIRQPDFIHYTQPTAVYPTSYTTQPTQRETKSPIQHFASPQHTLVVAPTNVSPKDEEPSKVDFVCKNGNGFYAVSNECDTYIECKNTIALKFTCPDGLHFNPAAKLFEYPCAYPSEVKCVTGLENQNSKPTNQCPRQYGFFSMNDGDCSKYVMCQAGVAAIMNCPAGLVFNSNKDSCDWQENVPQCNPKVFKGFTCPEAPVNDSGAVSNIIFKYRYKNECRLYIACQRGHPRLLSCERGLAFDETSQSCIDDDYVADCTTAKKYRA